MKTIKTLARVFGGMIGVLLVGCWEPPAVDTASHALVDHFSIPCSSGQDLNHDGNIEYYPVGLSDAVSIVFKESVDPNSFNVSTGISSSPSMSFTSSFATTSAANDTLILSPTSSYSAGQVYQVSLLMNSISPADPNSSYSQAGDSTTMFQAVDKATDTTYPYIVALDPVQNATNVPLNKVLKVDFSETMLSVRGYPASGYPSLPADEVVGTSDGITFTMTTESGLQPNTTYSIIIDPSDMGCNVGTMDHTGNRLVGANGSTQPTSIQWTFTTGAQ